MVRGGRHRLIPQVQVAAEHRLRRLARSPDGLLGRLITLHYPERGFKRRANPGATVLRRGHRTQTGVSLRLSISHAAKPSRLTSPLYGRTGTLRRIPGVTRIVNTIARWLAALATLAVLAASCGDNE